MENRKTEKSRTDGSNKSYSGKPARKGDFAKKEKRVGAHPTGCQKKYDNEKHHHKEGDKPLKKSRPAVKEGGAGGAKHRYNKNNSTERYERYETHDRYDKHEKREKSERYYKHERGERHNKRDRYDKPEKLDRPKRSERSEQNETVRLNKFIANSGICSRREADEYIKTGLVTVNGIIVTELGTKVKPDDDVRFNGQRLKGEKKVYLLMNKPKDYVTTMGDPHAKKCVIDLISTEKCKERVVPVGRLDKATTGVLLFTNDGDLAARLTHPSQNVKKIYHVFLDKYLKKTDFDALVNGITLEDGEIHADALSYVDDDMAQVGIEIHSGRNRVVRRMFEHLGYKVTKLDRVYFAGLTKKKLRRGAWRFLTEEEITFLKMGNFN
ncbi:MAG: pseudouridine synthase [Bacteroidales bacterium]|mgnify:CR=1 FL=1|jgi:23S rRNA pseudouridine2605 synthase|nr:pseudouridine synthase [Bacteroidales bacterium]